MGWVLSAAALVLAATACDSGVPASSPALDVLPRAGAEAAAELGEPPTGDMDPVHGEHAPAGPDLGAHDHGAGPDLGAHDHGAAGEPPPGVVGHVGDAAVDARGIVYVVDPAYLRVVAFDPGGRPVGTAHEGLEYPTGVAVRGDEVLVFDEGARAIFRFRGVGVGTRDAGERAGERDDERGQAEDRPGAVASELQTPARETPAREAPARETPAREAPELQALGRTSLELFARRMCVAAERVFLLGYHEGRILHEVDDQGRVAASFAEPFIPEPEVLARGITSGLLHCTTDARGEPVLVLAEERFPEVRAFSADGSLLWRQAPDDFRAVQVALTPDGSGIVFSDPADGEPPHRYVSITSWGDEILVQRGTAEPEMRSAAQITRVETRALDRTTGSLLARTDEAARVDWIVEGRWAFARALVPHAVVLRYELGVPEG